jgi:hypothetical protein
MRLIIRKESPYNILQNTLAADYVATIDTGQSCLVVCPTHSEGRWVTEEIRRLLKEKDEQDKRKLSKTEECFTTLENFQLTTAQRRDASNYRKNDVVVFHQNAKGG